MPASVVDAMVEEQMMEKLPQKTATLGTDT
jgi:hypothetical protein